MGKRVDVHDLHGADAAGEPGPLEPGEPDAQVAVVGHDDRTVLGDRLASMLDLERHTNRVTFSVDGAGARSEVDIEEFAGYTMKAVRATYLLELEDLVELIHEEVGFNIGFINIGFNIGHSNAPAFQNRVDWCLLVQGHFETNLGCQSVYIIS